MINITWEIRELWKPGKAKVTRGIRQNRALMCTKVVMNTGALMQQLKVCGNGKILSRCCAKQEGSSLHVIDVHCVVVLNCYYLYSKKK